MRLLPPLLLTCLATTGGCTKIVPFDDDSGDDSGADTEQTDTEDGPWSAHALLSLNLHCLRTDGTGFATNTERFAAIASAAAAEDVGAIALQEACVRPGESAMDLLEAALEAETGDDWSSAWALAHVAWEGTPDEADEGVGILVRGALTDPTPLTYQHQTSLVRVGIAATLPASLGGYRLHSVHLSVLDEVVRTAQAREAAAYGLVDADPSLAVVVAGNLNATEGTGAHGAFAAMGFRDLTDALDTTRIDHAFVHRGAPIESSGARLVFRGSTHPVVSDHPGVIVDLGPGSGEAVTTTRIDVHADVGFGHHVALRGDTAPLTWTEGWTASAVASDQWRLVFTEIPAGAIEYKALVDDVTWQTGDNASGTGGADNAVTPTF